MSIEKSADVEKSGAAKYRFRIRTRDGWELSNIMVHGADRDHAEKKLRRMYLYCEVLEGEVCDFSSTMRHVLTLRDEFVRRVAAH